MPLMAVRDYSDPEQLRAAYIGSEVEISPSRGAWVASRIARLELGHLRMLQLDELAPRIKWAVNAPDRTFIRFLTQPGSDCIIDGAALRPGELVRLGPGHAYYDRTNGPVHWAELSLPADELASAGAAITGRPIMAPRESLHITPRREAMSRI